MVMSDAEAEPDPEPTFLPMKSQPVPSERDSLAARLRPRLAVVGVAATLLLVQTVAPTTAYLWLRGERETGL